MHLPPYDRSHEDPPSHAIFYPPTPPQSPLPDSFQKSISSIFPTSALRVIQMEELSGHHLHHLVNIYLSNGMRLVLKVSPPPNKDLLRHERQLLRSEAAAYTALMRSGLPIPKVLKYESDRRHLGAPFLLISRLDGLKYSDVLPYLSQSERAGVDRQIRTISSIISRHCSSRFGDAGLVASGAGGYRTWREAFVSMMETLTMDGEEMMVNLSYFQIRAALSRWESYLDEVTEARLVVLGLGKPENILINRRTNEVTGLMDFGHAVWGDPAMAFVDGKTDIRSLLYTCYHCMVTIVRNHYRAENDGGEMEARKSLTRALNQLAVGS